MYTLASRDLTATDGAPVAGATTLLSRLVQQVVAVFTASVTGGPTTWDMRAAIEGSFDGGTTWTQVVRFKDITNAQLATQVVRASGVATIASLDLAASALGSAAAAAVLVEPPWSINLRAVTKLQTLTGGATPHVISAVYLEVSD